MGAAGCSRGPTHRVGPATSSPGLPWGQVHGGAGGGGPRTCAQRCVTPTTPHPGQGPSSYREARASSEPRLPGTAVQPGRWICLPGSRRELLSTVLLWAGGACCCPGHGEVRGTPEVGSGRGQPQPSQSGSQKAAGNFGDKCTQVSMYRACPEHGGLAVCLLPPVNRALELLVFCRGGCGSSRGVVRPPCQPAGCPAHACSQTPNICGMWPQQTGLGSLVLMGDTFQLKVRKI